LALFSGRNFIFRQSVFIYVGLAPRLRPDRALLEKDQVMRDSSLNLTLDRIGDTIRQYGLPIGILAAGVVGYLLIFRTGACDEIASRAGRVGRGVRHRFKIVAALDSNSFIQYREGCPD
jgi:hypothetical protein